MKRLKILLYIEQLSTVSPHSIERLSSLTSVLMSDEKVALDILPGSPMSKEAQASLSTNQKITWLPNGNVSKEMEDETATDISNKISELENKSNYHIIILHGKEIMSLALCDKYKQKVIPFLIDKNYQYSELEKVSKNFPAVFVESYKMKHLLLQTTDLLEDKVILIPPIIDDILSKPEFCNRYFSLLYKGKLSNEIISIFQTTKRKQTLFSMIILSNHLVKEREKLSFLNRYRKIKGLTAIENDSPEKFNRLIYESDLGYLFDYSSTSNYEQRETLKELLAFSIQGKPVIVNRNAQFEEILGEDYPLFAGSLQESKEKIILAFRNQEIYKIASERCFKASFRYQFSHVSNYILKKLWNFNQEKETILFAGHDFKFLKDYIAFCERSQLNVLIDKWSSHNVHNLEESQQLMQKADAIFCEWGLGNAVFYSNHRLPGQQLFIRVHRQELETNYLENVNYKNVTNVIAISPYIFEEFNRLKKIPRDKLILIQNMVDIKKYQQPKKENITHNLGIIGILPKLKRIDRVIDIFDKLWKKDKRYKLFIKGKLPEELPWLKNRKTEMEYFTEVFDKINDSPWKDHVFFDGHGDDVAEWLTNINYMLSTSDIESFHLAPMEGMASGATPIVFNWPGADTIYPKEFIVNNIDEAVELIVKLTKEDKKKDNNFLPIVEKYDISNINERLNKLIFK
ncbi:hypothetical protein CWR48_00520 [Oceanobacillus arenosus]|uniref:Glycosyl transferase family 1 domain-containing protein n=1 Tax=Oceanobacillus arenosus TaxID=1229153 RepID=A0A3D8Q1R4_9BACI|nr:glycosyltransferase [Oceanobacillus arenosus]RDW22224.1 hypothetical protein CWR48_00520 [Oceanobacillus arenosus]